MNIKNEATKAPPPKLISSLVGGFNLVTNHIQLIVFPIILDLLIWFGPHLRIMSLMQTFISDFGKTIQSLSSPDLQTILQDGQQIWNTLLEHFNLVGLIRTFPVGVPSLLSGQGSLLNPLGQPPIFEITSGTGLILFFLGFIMIGILYGSLYFSEIARVSFDPKRSFSVSLVVKQWLQTILFSLVLLAVLIIIAIPVIFLLSLISLISQDVAQIILIIISLFILWLLVPFIFSPHGIFMNQLNVFAAMLNSLRLVRFILPGTGMFLISALLITQGMDILWLLPPDTSWMVLIGIIGHAFIATGLLAASFVYYRDGLLWVAENLKSIAPGKLNNQANITKDV
jgi:hypothetical protein